MNKRSVIGAVVCSALMGNLAWGAAALAADQTTKKIKPETLTCEEFLALGEDERPRVVYWIDGYTNSGKLAAEGIGVETFKRPIAVIVDECKKTPKETLWQKIKSYF
jgi:acid stress chaperone HdeA